MEYWLCGAGFTIAPVLQHSNTPFLSESLPEFLQEEAHDRFGVTHKPQIGHFENGRLRITVDGDDVFCPLNSSCVLERS